jgi:hypothetical protein
VFLLDTGPRQSGRRENNLTRKQLKLPVGFYLSLILLLIACPSLSFGKEPAGTLKPRVVPEKPLHTVIGGGQSRKVIEVKFVEGSRIRIREGRLTTAGNYSLDSLELLLNRYPVKKVESLFSRTETELAAERLSAVSRSGEEMADLNLYYRLVQDDDSESELLIDALNALSIVEIAYPAPLPAPPPGFFLPVTGGEAERGSLSTSTPNYMKRQRYLNKAPGGIHARKAWKKSGGKGNRTRIINIEYNYNRRHEDLSKARNILLAGKKWNGFGNQHGTAVLGQLVADRNDYGITGIAHRAKIRFISPCNGTDCGIYNPANAVSLAQLYTKKGDVILLEQQAEVCGSEDYGPMEWYQSVYDAIRIATASGRNVIAVAGNGGVDLDSPQCLGRFNRAVRDSGAIIVGAGVPPVGNLGPDRSRMYYSSYGSRVDLQGWGARVCTTGYGDLQGDSKKNKWYTKDFGGTSSAAPIVAGAVSILSSIAQARGSNKSPGWIRSVLVSTGSPQQDAPSYPASENIGPRPNLKEAIGEL